MNGLIKAEFRKIFTTHLWWALLIPVVVLSFLAGWGGTEFGQMSIIRQMTGGQDLPTGLLTMSLSTNYVTVFAALLGALAMTGEYRHKTATTTFLTANPRGAVLGAKLIAYTNIALIYGIANTLFASLGGLLGAGSDGFGEFAQWLMVGGAGILSIVLWTLLGLGFGAMVTSSVVAVLVLLGYVLVFESLVSSAMSSSAMSWLGDYLPGAASNGIVSNLSVPMFVSDVAGAREPMVSETAYRLLHSVFGGSYGFPWWGSLLVFAGYAAVFVAGGWLTSSKRDIT
ncbi:ABC-2 type transport system permease protein [Actinopolyspora biskrensis]|uniref:ABC-2 type transport system permease protein n=1 Tax=Actinopolyspora biskrensis TaxID=1470178 RepID=A0A852Z132_9ACTN|nr:ABC transporter permease [Actinopolyspora biskrensis]NYH79479.1 ABC-2 type transport system permease protein [Actinopolyspora biskrensis]